MASFFQVNQCNSLKQIQLMIKGGKQRYQMKSILKEKLISYQNQSNKEPQIVIYDSINTNGSEKLGLSDYFKRSIQMASSKCKGYNEYDQYLNSPTFDEDFIYNKKSLTRHNIFAINKKAKAIKSSLNQIAKQKKSIEDTFVPLRSLQKQMNFTPEKRDKIFQSVNINNEVKTLDDLLTIKKQKNSKTQRFMQKNTKRPASHHEARIYKQHSSSSKLLQTQNRPKTSKTQYCSQKINPQVPLQLTQYFTPCYHKQTNSGYIVNDFQPRLKAKHFEDNVKVMAKVIKKKIFNLQREEIVKYLKKIGERKKYSQPDNTIKQTVRKTNYLHEKNILEQKIKKTTRAQSSKKSFSKKM